MTANISPSDTFYVRDLLRQRTAIQVDDSKQYLLETRLSRLATDGGYSDASQLIKQARSGDAALDTKIIEAMTTHETSFFRDLHPFHAIQHRVLPELIAAREKQRRLCIWSAACSSGQEPYSIAMLLLEHFPALEQWPVRIVATDLSEKVLSRARLGRFSQLELNRGLPASLLLKYFDRTGAEWQIKPQVSQLIDFRRLNLLDAWHHLRPDVVFLRNVLIYFDVPAKKEILARVREVMAPDGALFLGSAETTFGVDDNWECVRLEKSSYYRPRR